MTKKCSNERGEEDKGSVSNSIYIPVKIHVLISKWSVLEWWAKPECLEKRGDLSPTRILEWDLGSEWL